MTKDGWVDVNVTGVRELDQVLSSLPDAIAQQKVLAQSVAAGARVVSRRAKQLCPVVTGNLRKSIRLKRKENKNGRVIYQVGTGRSKAQSVDGWYGHLVEFGTGVHMIYSKKEKVLKLRFNKRTGAARRWISVGRDGVRHPGSSPRPFLRPAFDESTDLVVKAMRKRLKVGVEKEARKLAIARNRARRAARRAGR